MPAKKTLTNQLKKKFLSKIEKDFDKGLTVFADDDDGKIERLPWGIGQLDWLTLGGVPCGKVTILRGPESGTKTTLAIIACQKYLERYKDRLAIFIDAEEKCPQQFVKRLKIDGGRFATTTPGTMEQTIDYLEACIRNPTVGILVLDSIAAMVPRIEIEASAEDQQQGIAARHVNKMVRKIVGAIKMARVERGWAPTIILVNQERIRIGVRFGDPTTLPGGQGQMFAASLIVRVRSLTHQKIEGEKNYSVEDPVVRAGFAVQKHSFGPKGATGEYLLAMNTFGSLMPGEAADEEFVRGIAVRTGLIRRAGSQWVVLDEPPSSSMAEISQKLNKRSDTYKRLKEALIESLTEAT